MTKPQPMATPEPIVDSDVVKVLEHWLDEAKAGIKPGL